MASNLAKMQMRPLSSQMVKVKAGAGCLVGKPIIDVGLGLDCVAVA